jgi:hypothetical protein
MDTSGERVPPLKMSRLVRGAFPDRQFDVDFWQQQGDSAIFAAALQMTAIVESVRGTKAFTTPDFKDLLRLLNKYGVRYIVVGEYAVMKYTEPFFSTDIELWIDAAPDNAERTYKALAEFGAPVGELAASDLSQPDVVFQFGVAPARVDVMTAINGVGFAEAWDMRAESIIDDIPVSFLSLEHLKQNKRAFDRDTDRVHLARLEKCGRQ